MSPLKLGVIGLGYIGQVHLRHIRRILNAQVVAAADLSRKALTKARNDGVKTTYTNYEKLLENPEIDAVIIALPTHLHLDCALKAAEAKKHIFLEKPIARNVKEAREVVSAARKNSVKLMIGYPLRFNTELRGLKQRISRGEFGDVEIAYASYISSGPFFHRAEGYAPVPVPEWWFNKELTGGGVLVDLGSHVINLLRWYFGEITDIRAQLGYRLNMDVEDSAICFAKFQGGTRAIVNVGWFSQQYQLKIDLLGSVKHFTVNHVPSNPISTVIQMLTSGTSRFYFPHQSELRYFVDCLIRGLNPQPSGQDGLQDLITIAHAYENEIHLE